MADIMKRKRCTPDEDGWFYFKSESKDWYFNEYQHYKKIFRANAFTAEEYKAYHKSTDACTGEIKGWAKSITWEGVNQLRNSAKEKNSIVSRLTKEEAFMELFDYKYVITILKTA